VGRTARHGIDEATDARGAVACCVHYDASPWRCVDRFNLACTTCSGFPRTLKVAYSMYTTLCHMQCQRHCDSELGTALSCIAALTQHIKYRGPRLNCLGPIV
jgi:hypothetical protein